MKKIKEQCVEVFDNKDSLTKNQNNKNDQKSQTYLLPDGSPIQLNNERFLAPEILFDPGRIGYEYQGVH